MRVGQVLQDHQEKITKKYKNMYEALGKIKTILSGWKPSSIFYDSNREYIEHDEPIINRFGVSYGYSYNDFNYTKLGQYFEDAPDIVSLLKVFWYIPTCVVYMISNIIWFIIELFLSAKIKDLL